MFAVIFEVVPTKEGKEEYLEIAAKLRTFLENRDGFISIERFQSLVDENKILSLSFWRDEAAIANWRNLMEHRNAQSSGKKRLFESYRIRVAEVVRDYTETERDEAPQDSINAHG
ncbi:antibiotic biosynthesis monooxygenase [Neptuniibacter sp.]|uniref:antibiotic biosynthesis monooxygenase family protein n=1 Tax=Neptuniibacter sp. TaxID=1962643 RepID=UPI00263A2275|nr:antibiotic biosynthesis monooxygenase [Neptuniibacter sp.]MCP4596607.1 antibiotic biosynthesis monooxygenase [Neptuniibacter sp.]